MTYFLGVDAGATKTQCVLGTAAEVLARAQSGSIKTTRVDRTDAEKNLEDILSSITGQSGVALGSIASICVGLSGNAIPSVVDWVRDAFASRTRCPLMICGDEEIALDAAFHDGRGILAIAGTGSHVVGRTSTGELVRTGGWGPVLSDQGAGSRTGLLAVRAIFHAMDASEGTSLLPALHAAWNTRTVEELVDRGNRVPGPDFSRLAPMVAQCAAQGDVVARKVLQQSGEELADLIVLAMHKGDSVEALASFGAPKVHSTSWTIAITGSIIENIFLLRESMQEAVRRADPAVQFLSQPADAVLGAFWRARTRLRNESV